MENAPVNIREYTESDRAAVVAIYHSNIPKYFDVTEEPDIHRFLNSRPEHYYVVEQDGQVVAAGGIAVNDPANPAVTFCMGMVKNELIGSGLGKILAEFRLRLADEIFPGLPFILETSQHTAGFYEKYGFATVEHIKDGFAPGIDNCKMRRERQKI